MLHKTVVFIGGGYATMTVLKKLIKKRVANITLILVDPKEGFYHSVGAPR